MNKIEIKELKLSLMEQQVEMINMSERHGISSTSSGETLADENERADRVAGDMVESQLGYSESKHLQDIAIALEKIDDGSYGICEECKGIIFIERLRALPYVSCCIECQSKKEKVAAGVF